MRRRLVLALLSVLFAVPGIASAQSNDGTTELNPGDQIRIVVWRKPEMSGDFVVGANGTIIHPLYREVSVTGVPLSTVEDRLRTFLTKYETAPQFVIQPLVRIVVGGEVRSPNIFSVPPETTIAQAVALAGGPTDRGKLNDVRIIRDGQQIRADLSSPNSDVASLRIRSGDQILVNRRSASAREIIGPVTSSIAAAAAIISIFIRP